MIDHKRKPVKPPVKRAHIPMQDVESSAIKAIGHDAKTKTLRVEFLTGGIYDYPDVTVEHHNEILAAESKGRHISHFVRGRQYTKHLPKAA